MSALNDLSRFVVLFSLAGLSYLLIAEGGSFDDQWIAIGALVFGMLAVVLIAYRFREDYQREDDAE
ncbi:hypothetical protein GCM10028857_05510 [Salinarchaeum chitinilyticum]